MSIKGVTDYFTTRLKEIEAAFNPHEDAFNIDNIGATKFDRAYHILPLELTCSPPSGATVTDFLTVEIYLFFQGYRDPLSKLVSAFDTANNFRINCVRPRFANVDTSFGSVVCKGIKPEAVQSNDNAIRFKMTFYLEITTSIE